MAAAIAAGTYVFTKEVVATKLELSLDTGVGAITVPVKVGLAVGANGATALATVLFV